MKDSEIEWIGEIPQSWEITKIKNISNFKNGMAHESEMDIEGKYVVVNSRFISTDGMIKKYCNNQIMPLKKSDICIVLSDVPNGKAYSKCYVIEKDNHYTLNQRIGCFFDLKTNLRFFYYFVNRNQGLLMYDDGINQTNLRKPDLLNCRFLSPSLLEQQEIADFLDRKCSLIDSTIERQNAIIEKLKFYKQSVITEAVTKGLDRTAKMKPSGDDWIGDIPEGWEARKLKYLGDLSANGVDKKIQEGEKLYKSVQYMNVYNNSLSEIKNSEDYLIISASDAKANSCTLEKGDVLFTNSSETPDDMGHSTVVCGKLYNTLFGYHLMRFRPEIEIHLQFEKYLFGSYYMRKWFEYRSTGMTRYGISYSDFAEALIILPTLLEQQDIADYLDAKCEGIDNVINSKQNLIEKLIDYKKSLIYECVTGKKEVV